MPNRDREAEYESAASVHNGEHQRYASADMISRTWSKTTDRC